MSSEMLALSPHAPVPRVVLVDPARHVPAYDRALAEALAQCGWDVTLATGPRVHDRVPAPIDVREVVRFARGLKANPSRDSAPRGRAKRRLRRAIGYPFEWAGLVRSLRVTDTGAPVLHVQWALLPPFEAPLYRQLRRRGVRVVHTVHNVLPHEPSPLAAWRWRRLYAAADALIVHSQATAQRLRRLLEETSDPRASEDPRASDGGPLPRSRDRVAPSAPGSHPSIHVVPMGPFAPFEATPPTRSGARAALGLPPAAPLALFFGLIRPYKGLDLLLEAWDRLRRSQPQARLLIAGPVPGGEEAAAAWRKRIDTRGLGAAVVWRPGYVAEEEVSNYLAAADVVVLPYSATDDSAVLALARGHGRAVLATDVGGLREALAAGGGRLTPPGDAVRLATALGALLADPEARRALEVAQRAAAERWTWAHVARATSAVYRPAVVDGDA